ncbi:peptide-methionine (S)-S-oxide reductase MsrA (plasmid) [Cupriavidus necator]|uniref:Peptide methionine sulfoxide reductase MsrA n=1 Tax=Cupriavidus necator TaxID=106590 RepID=A0A367PN01_CUPNE|nr:peptide-methionine (S)-S-oxide reductase MsrA [Cupriavidus necator]QQX89249.1 peptide-methionine (S)-S-oxide reductase MsrA [Cupriavidus necator]RCJ08385.1 peptide-methionine (S)-S-oxide reductase [Cupriavidus necator]
MKVIAMLQRWTLPTTVRLAGLAMLAALVAGVARPVLSAEAAVKIPAASVDEKPGASRSQTAVFAGGCFWGVQGVFEHVRGVTRVTSGYAGGAASTAQYERVGTGSTGHAESVEIRYDPAQISYGKLLQIFFSVAHNPTQLNYQGPDHGTQYRSSIFPLTPEQRSIAQAYIAQLDGARSYRAPIVTRIEDYKGFYAAEDYHQDFLVKNPTHPYIVINDLPKIANLKAMFPEVYRNDAVLVTKGAG